MEQTETEEFVIQAHVPKYAHQHCFFDEEELDESDDGDANCEQQRDDVTETAVASNYSQVMDKYEEDAYEPADFDAYPVCEI